MSHETHRYKCPICRTPWRSQELADACERTHVDKEMGRR